MQASNPSYCRLLLSKLRIPKGNMSNVWQKSDRDRHKQAKSCVDEKERIKKAFLTYVLRVF
jgi:hypothetical protein